MARSRLTVCLLTALPLLTLVLLPAPAVAQFDSIFSNAPPRPPGSVGSPQTLPPPADITRQPDFQSGVDVRRPTDLRGDQPPSQPLPSPMSLPPSGWPGGGTIQSQELPPPPGTLTAPPGAAAAPPTRQPPIQTQPQQGLQPPGPAQATLPNTLPGLPPGIRQPRGTPGDTLPQTGDEVVVAPPPQRIANPTAVFSGLDKITGRIISFDVAINETVQFGALQVTPRVCYSRPPTETPNTDAFVEVDEVTLQGEIKRIFSGWMFAASPGLHAIEHPIYDVWITDCKSAQNPNVAAAQVDENSQAMAKIAPRLPPVRPARPR